MAKAPKDSPVEKGENIKLRGSNNTGVVIKADGKWMWINWNEPIGKECKKIHHAYELVRIKS
jgi:hypothetical protein